MNIFGTDNYDDVQRMWEYMTWKYDCETNEIGDDICNTDGFYSNVKAQDKILENLFKIFEATKPVPQSKIKQKYKSKHKNKIQNKYKKRRVL